MPHAKRRALLGAAVRFCFTLGLSSTLGRLREKPESVAAFDPIQPRAADTGCLASGYWPRVLEDVAPCAWQGVLFEEGIVLQHETLLLSLHRPRALVFKKVQYSFSVFGEAAMACLAVTQEALLREEASDA